MKSLLLALSILICSRVAVAEFTASSNINFVTAGIVDINVKSLTYLGYGSGSFMIGPVLMANRYHQEYSELGYGGLIQVGREFFLQLGGGGLNQTLYSKNKNGMFGVLVLGWNFSGGFAVTFPIIYRSVSKSTERIDRVDAYPMIGLVGRFL